MRLLLATAALAAVIASPALAQQQTAPSQESPPIADRPIVQEPPATVGQGAQPKAPAPHALPGTAVYDSQGKVIGADPDPRVRDQLKMDPPLKPE
jgi:hypothetical protein